jgi:hypothetical protein
MGKNLDFSIGEEYKSLKNFRVSVMGANQWTTASARKGDHRAKISWMAAEGDSRFHHRHEGAGSKFIL